MSRPLPSHNFVEILEAEREPSPPSLLSTKTRDHISARPGLHATFNRQLACQLSVELLDQIFSHYFDTSPAVNTPTSGPLVPGLYNNMTQQLSPLRLSHVCSYWRAVLSSNPKFWTSLCIIGPYYKQAYPVDTWLTRAKPLPTDILFIQTDIACRVPHDLEEATDQVLSVLMQHSSSWKRLRLEFKIVECQWALSRINSRKLGQLEELHFEIPPWTTSRPELDRFWANIYQAPSLSRVSWNMFRLHPPFHLTRWQHLTWLNCDGSITQSDLWSILKITPRLIRLRARGISIADPYQPPIFTSFKHKTLEIVDLEFKSPPTMIYRNLEIPKLKSLRISQNSKAWHVSDTSVMGALSSFFLSLSDPPELHSFTLLDPSISDRSLFRILQSRPLRNLTHLELEAVTPMVLSSMTFRPSTMLRVLPDPGLPHLQELRILNPYQASEQWAINPDFSAPEHYLRSRVRRLLRSRPRGFVIRFGDRTFTLDNLDELE